MSINLEDTRRKIVPCPGIMSFEYGGAELFLPASAITNMAFYSDQNCLIINCIDLADSIQLENTVLSSAKDYIKIWSEERLVK